MDVSVDEWRRCLRILHLSYCRHAENHNVNYSSPFQRTRQTHSGKPFKPHPQVAVLLKQLKKNTITVLKEKEHASAGILQNIIAAILLALKKNMLCQALYF